MSLEVKGNRMENIHAPPCVAEMTWANLGPRPILRRLALDKFFLFNNDFEKLFFKSVPVDFEICCL